MKKVYLDNGSTSFPKGPGVGEAMAYFITEVGCNVGRGGYENAYAAADIVFETRSLLCKLFHFPDEKHVVFTPGVTYSLNFVIKGLLKKGDHVILSAVEHNAAARPCKEMEAEGVELTIAPCDKTGRIDFEAFEKSFRPNTRLVVINHASNVCGTIQDAERIGEICSRKGAFFVLDAAQSGGVVPVDFQKMKLSGLCITGHKGLLGPQGIGALLLSPRLAESLKPVISGGTGSASHLLAMPDFMPDKFEAGTLNLPGIFGLHRSLEYILETGTEEILRRELSLAEMFMEGLKQLSAAESGIKIIGTSEASGRMGTVSVDFTEILDNAEAAFVLDDEYGIMTRCGLHCAPLAHRSLGTYPNGTVRFSFGHRNTEAEVNYALKAISEITNLKKLY